MRLIDAINHAREVSESQYACEECKQEHKQLAEWLEELEELREKDRWIPCSERLPEHILMITSRSRSRYISKPLMRK